MIDRGPLFVSCIVVACPELAFSQRKSAIDATVSSLLAQNWDAEFIEVLVTGETGGYENSEVSVVPRTNNAEGTSSALRNAAALKACGDVVLFLDAGVTLELGSLAAAVSVFDSSEAIAAVGLEIRLPDGTIVGRSRWGFDLINGPQISKGDGQPAERVLSFDSRAALVAPAVFERSLGFQPDLEGFAADLDLGWAFNSMGFRCVATSSAVARAAEQETNADQRQNELTLEQRVRVLFSCADEQLFRSALPLMLSGGGDRTSGVEQLLGSRVEPLAKLRKRRLDLRKRADFEFVSLFGGVLAVGNLNSEMATLAEATGIIDAIGVGRNIVVATADNLSEQMAGPAIRSWKIAEALATEHNVRLLANKATIDSDLFEIQIGNDRNYRNAVEWCDIFIFQGWILAGRPYIAESEKILIADIYDPMHLEQLEQAADGGSEFRRKAVEDTVGTLNAQLLRSDFMVCASDEQRSFWLGQLAALGRVNPETYDEDPTLRSLIDVVPFGVSDEPPQQTAHGIRGVFDGIGPDDQVILWGGGLYNWFDPLTLVNAVNQMSGDFPNLRLVFMGMAHPNPDVPRMRVAAETEELSDRLGLTGKHVFFNRSWVPYTERQNFLCDADLGVATHFPGIETDFAFRTRILDYLWASLPTVSTEGGSLSNLVEKANAGITVKAADTEGLVMALTSLLSDPELCAEMSRNAKSLGDSFRWNSALQPLMEFCRNPRRAPDLLAPEITESLLRDLAPPPLARRGLIRRLMVVLKILDETGVRGVAERIAVIAKQKLRK